MTLILFGGINELAGAECGHDEGFEFAGIVRGYAVCGTTYFASHCSRTEGS